MGITRLTNWLRGPRTMRTTRRDPDIRALKAERLEERDAPALFTVDWDGYGVKPDGKVSLQEAIDAANLNAGPDQIQIQVAKVRVADFAVNAGDTIPGKLPDIFEGALTIEGNGAVINLESKNKSNAISGFHVTLDAANSVIRNLSITDPSGTAFFNGPGEYGVKVTAVNGGLTLHNVVITNIDGTGVVISDSKNNTVGGGANQAVVIGSVLAPNNSVGILITGAGSTGNLVQQTKVDGNAGDGILINNGAASNTIGGSTAGNVIVSNFGAGVRLDNGDSNRIQRNLIGTDGTNALANGLDGVLIENGSADNIIGGANLAAGNVISGNTGSGVTVRGATSSANSIQGNRIGLNASGDAALANSNYGVLVDNAAATRVGATAAAPNYISGNNLAGVAVFGAGSAGTIVANNRIGLVQAEDAALGNGGDGVLIDGATKVTVGGSGAKSFNVIGGNQNGVAVLKGSTSITVQGNRIGFSEVGGTITDVGNAQDGVTVVGSSGVVIGGTQVGMGNTISGNANGVSIFGSSAVTLQGNYIGTNPLGDNGAEQPAPNNGNGVVIDASTNVLVGTPGSNSGNVISRNNGNGVDIRNGSSAVTVQNNKIGTQKDAAVTPDLGNLGSGVVVDASTKVLIGGTSPLTANTIAKNVDGVLVSSGSTLVTVQGNLIRNNAQTGVRVDNSSKVVIGGETATAANTIANTLRYPGASFQVNGIHLLNGTHDVTVQGNFIGTDASASRTAGNRGDGILIDSAFNNLIGGTKHLATGDGVEHGNVIAYNFHNGIAVLQDLLGAGTATGNRLLGNSIYSNGSAKFSGLGINLNTEGGLVDENDPLDKDPGANNTQNYPVLTRVDGTNGDTRVTGYLESTPDRTFRIEFFGSDEPSQTGSPVEYGQGKQYLGFIEVGKDNEITPGRYEFQFTTATALQPLWVVAATATDTTTGDTSEFSKAMYVDTLGPNTYVVNSDGGFYTTLGNPNLRVLNGTMTLARAIELANQHPGTDRIFFALRPQVIFGTGTTGATTFQYVGDSRTVLVDINLPDITDTVVIDGSRLAWPQAPADQPYPGAPGDNGLGQDYTIQFRNALTGFVVSDNQLPADAALNPNASAGFVVLRNFPEITGKNGYGITLASAKGNTNLQNIQGPGGLTPVGGINGFAQGGILITNSPGNIVGGADAGQGIWVNRISAGNGVHITGAKSIGNLVQQTKIGNKFGVAADGILIDGDASNNIIGGFTSSPVETGNLIVRSNKNGIHIRNSNGNRVQRNFIGNDGDSTALPNAQDGILIEDSSDNLIGGEDLSAKNLISGNTENGLRIRGAKSSSNRIESNFFGLNASGKAALPNSGNGVLIEGAPGTRVGSTTTAANYISGNNLNGVLITGAGSAGSVVVNNRIGIDFDGKVKLGNVQDGIQVSGATGITVGGGGTKAVNIIGGNRYGVAVVNKSTNVTVKGNWVGLNKLPDGSYPNLGNLQDGVLVQDSSSVLVGGTQQLEGNKIASNRNGVRVFKSDDVTLQGNFIGTNLTGTIVPIIVGKVEDKQPVFQAEDGVLVESSTNVRIGTPAPGGGNLISNNRHGVSITKGSSDVKIQNNLIGTQSLPAGQPNGFSKTKHDLGNLDDGVFVDASTNVLIGGTGAAEGNIIARNLDGIQISGGSSEVKVQQNIIRNNRQSGVRIEASNNNTIGGNTAAARNQIFNRRLLVDTTFNVDGVFLNNGSSGNVVSGNWIGTDGTIATDVGNIANGVLIDASSDNLIGGTTHDAAKKLEDGNVIANNLQNGIAVLTASGKATGNRLWGNVNYGNARLGIDLGSTAGDVTPNDDGDPGIGLDPDTDTGANNLQNYPVIDLAESNISIGTRIQFHLNSTPNRTFRIEFFHIDQPNQGGSQPNYGQAKTYVGFKEVKTGESGRIADTFLAEDVVLPASEFVTATATDLTTNDTSEYALDSLIVGVIGPVTYVVNHDGGFYTSQIGRRGFPDVLPAPGNMSLAQAITLANQHPGEDRIVFRIAPEYSHNPADSTLQYDKESRWVWTNGDLPDITDTLIIDGSPLAWPQIFDGDKKGFEANYTIIFNKGSHGFRISDNPTDQALFTNPLAKPNLVVVRHLNITGFQTAPGVEITTNQFNTKLFPNLTGPRTHTEFYGGANLQDVTITGFNSDGVRIVHSPNNIIGGSGANQLVTITTIGGTGVNIIGKGSTFNLVQQTNIGFPVSTAGTGGPGGNGIWIQNADHNTIGGFTDGTGVRIQGAAANGIYLLNANGTRIQRSIIGDPFGQDDGKGKIVFFPNHFDGIRVENSGVAADGTPTLIGGVTKAAGNTIAGNTEHGIRVLGAKSAGLLVQSNQIGTKTAPNSGHGILVDNVANVLIGSTVTAANAVDGNNLSGIYIRGAASKGARVVNTSAGAGGGNLEEGIVVEGVEDVIIGGSGKNAGGTIAGNRKGIFLLGASKVTVQQYAITGNSEEGVRIDASKSVQIGGTASALSGNTITKNRNGVLTINGSSIVTLQGNTINDQSEDGVLIDNTGNVRVGTPSQFGNNTITGNRNGVRVVNGSTDFSIENNLIGSKTGAGNQDAGIRLDGITGAKIGGTGSLSSNFVSGNRNGLHLAAGSKLALVQGNVFANSTESGILLEGSSENVVGGKTAPERNAVFSNALMGIYLKPDLSDPGVPVFSHKNTIQGNFIGVDQAGTGSFGNGVAGIYVDGGSNNLIGGTIHDAKNKLEQGNVIANTVNGSGVVIVSDTGLATGNSLLGNGIFGNKLLGIELGGNDGTVTINDKHDTDAGPNDLQNFPELEFAEVGLVSSVARGKLHSSKNSVFRIEFFGDAQANPNGNPAGHGQGKTYLGALEEVRTDDNGDAYIDANGNGVRDAGEDEGFSFFAPQSFAAGGVLSATATRLVLAGGKLVPTNTSEFSKAKDVEIAVGKIEGFKFEDKNGNGVRDTGEPGLPGWVIELEVADANGKFDGVVDAKVTTDASGHYEFANLTDGQYQLSEVLQAGWVQTAAPTPNPMAITGGITIGDADFGNFKTVKVTGLKFEDKNGNGVRDTGERGLDGFTIQLLDAKTNVVYATTTTDLSGNYAFTGLYIGRFGKGDTGFYRVREIQKPDYTQTTPNPADFQIVSGVNVGPLDFGNQKKGGGVIENPINYIIVGAGEGSVGTVRAYNAKTSVQAFSFVPFGTKFKGGVRVAKADVTGDKQADIIVAPGAGTAPVVKVYDGTNGKLVERFSNFNVFDPTYKGGVYIATGDVNGDGTPDLIAGTGSGAPLVRVFDGKSGAAILSFNPFAGSAKYNGGVRVAAGDVNADGFADIITAPGKGKSTSTSIGPVVRVWDTSTGDPVLMRDFLAYEASFKRGLFVAGGDVNGDGFTDIIVAPDAGRKADVRVYDGATNKLLDTLMPPTGPTSKSMVFSDVARTSGLRVAAIDLDNDGQDEIMIGAGRLRPPRVLGYNPRNGKVMLDFQPFPSTFRGGVFVG